MSINSYMPYGTALYVLAVPYLIASVISLAFYVISIVIRRKKSKLAMMIIALICGLLVAGMDIDFWLKYVRMGHSVLFVCAVAWMLIFIKLILSGISIALYMYGSSKEKLL